MLELMHFCVARILRSLHINFVQLSNRLTAVLHNKLKTIVFR